MGSFTRDDNTYSSKTLIGQWTEKRKVEQDRIEDFLERCKRENLAIQKMTRLYQSIMQDVSEINANDYF
ncbi:unnamed protein product [Trichobilharzia regenti]|nr:unnamed protein product [Trichobilharzia regenti]